MLDYYVEKLKSNHHCYDRDLNRPIQFGRLESLQRVGVCSYLVQHTRAECEGFSGPYLSLTVSGIIPAPHPAPERL